MSSTSNPLTRRSLLARLATLAAGCAAGVMAGVNPFKVKAQAVPVADAQFFGDPTITWGGDCNCLMHVRSGDMISASEWNRMVDAVNRLSAESSLRNATRVRVLSHAEAAARGLPV